MKNRVKLLGIIVIIGLLITACGDGDTTHTCSFENWTETTAPTCVAKGIETGTCSCGKTSTRDGADENPTAHDWDNYEGTEPSCLVDGEGTATCTLCGVENDITKQKLGHSFTVYTSNDNATCLDDGTETAICDRCDIEDEKTEEDTALGHDMEVSGEITKAATCTEDGIGKKECSRCDHSEPYGIIQKLGHSFTVWGETRAATCTVENQETRTCTRSCGETGHIETQSTVPAKGHTWSVWGNSTATCTVAGIETRTCTLACGLTGHTENRPATALGHIFTAWGNSTATCIVAGNETRTCTLACGLTGHTETRSVVELGHDHFQSLICNRDGCDHQYAIGDTGPAGGIIFYVAPAGFTMTDDDSTAYYLEAAPVNIATALRWSTVTWEEYEASGFDDSLWVGIPGTSWGIGSGIGTGRKNSALILELDVTAPAALACNNYFVAGYETFNDWFLPSTDELGQLYIRRADVGITFGWFWSSSQTDKYRALGHRFDVDIESLSENLKTSSNDVRAVRAF